MFQGTEKPAQLRLQKKMQMFVLTLRAPLDRFLITARIRTCLKGAE